MLNNLFCCSVGFLGFCFPRDFRIYTTLFSILNGAKYAQNKRTASRIYYTECCPASEKIQKTTRVVCFVLGAVLTMRIPRLHCRKTSTHLQQKNEKLQKRIKAYLSFQSVTGRPVESLEK